MSLWPGAITVDNLDGLSTEPEDFREASELFSLLSSYCALRASALEYRVRGNIPVALTMEAACEQLYKRLPEWARW